MNNKEAIERLNFVQETVDCIRNTFNQNAENDKLIRNCMALLQNAIDGEYHDMEEVNASEIKRPHGKWIKSDVPESMLAKCSLCGFDCGAYSHNFCPNCGADMRRKKEE